MVTNTSDSRRGKGRGDPRKQGIRTTSKGKMVKRKPKASVPKQGRVVEFADIILRIAVVALNDENTILLRPEEPFAVVGPDQALKQELIMNVIAGSLDEFRFVAGEVAHVGWLLRAAHGIFDPAQKRGILYSYPDGQALDDWITRPRNESWTAQPLHQPLEARIYEYVVPDGVKVHIPRISKRHTESATSRSQLLGSKTFKEQTQARDTCCIVSKARGKAAGLRASHIVPKRLNKHLGEIVNHYVNIPSFGTVDVMDPRVGITLQNSMDDPFDHFLLGLYHNLDAGRNSFIAQWMHPPPLFLEPSHGYHFEYKTQLNFIDSVIFQDAQADDAGVGVEDTGPGAEDQAREEPGQEEDGQEEDGQEEDGQEEDGRRARQGGEDGEELEYDEDDFEEDSVDSNVPKDTNSSDTFAETYNNPKIPYAVPAGLLLWHFTQCILHKFGTKELWGLPRIAYSEVPSRFRGQSDDEDCPETPEDTNTYPYLGLPICVHGDSITTRLAQWANEVTEALDPSEFSSVSVR